MPILKTEIRLEEFGFGTVYAATENVVETESALLEYELPAGTADQAIPQSFTTGITNPYIVLIEADQDISWRLAITDTAVPVDAGGFAMLYRTNITSLFITNATTQKANIKIWLSGVA